MSAGVAGARRLRAAASARSAGARGSRAATSRRTGAPRRSPPPTAPIWPTTSPGGSMPPRPEVSTRSPTAEAGAERQEAQLRLGRVVALQDRLVARALDHHRDARVEIGDQQDARAAPADIDHPPGQPLGRHRGHADGDALVGAGVEQQGVDERPAGIGDHARRGPGRRLDPSPARSASGAAPGSARRAWRPPPASRAGGGSPRAAARSRRRRPGSRRRDRSPSGRRRPAGSRPAGSAPPRRSTARPRDWPASRPSSPSTSSTTDRPTRRLRRGAIEPVRAAGPRLGPPAPGRDITAVSVHGGDRPAEAGHQSPCSGNLARRGHRRNSTEKLSRPSAARCAASTSPRGTGRCPARHRSAARRRW